MIFRATRKPRRRRCVPVRPALLVAPVTTYQARHRRLSAKTPAAGSISGRSGHPAPDHRRPRPTTRCRCSSAPVRSCLRSRVAIHRGKTADRSRFACTPAPTARLRSTKTTADLRLRARRVSPHSAPVERRHAHAHHRPTRGQIPGMLASAPLRSSSSRRTGPSAFSFARARCYRPLPRRRDRLSTIRRSSRLRSCPIRFQLFSFSAFQLFSFQPSAPVAGLPAVARERRRERERVDRPLRRSSRREEVSAPLPCGSSVSEWIR